MHVHFSTHDTLLHLSVATQACRRRCVLTSLSLSLSISRALSLTNLSLPPANALSLSLSLHFKPRPTEGTRVNVRLSPPRKTSLSLCFSLSTSVSVILCRYPAISSITSSCRHRCPTSKRVPSCLFPSITLTLSLSIVWSSSLCLSLSNSHSRSVRRPPLLPLLSLCLKLSMNSDHPCTETHFSRCLSTFSGHNKPEM